MFVRLLAVSTAPALATSLLHPQLHQHHQRQQQQLHASVILPKRHPQLSSARNGRCFRLFSSLAEKEKVENVNGATAYDAQQITVLSGLEPVRKRPGM